MDPDRWNDEFLRRPSVDGDDELAQLLWEYVNRLNSGERADEDRIREEHPDLADELIRELDTFRSFGLSSDGSAPLGTLGDYTLRRQIGRGGMGVVYEAWENSMDRQVALKVLPAGIAADAKACTRFMREAQTAGKLNHPNVVGVYSTGVKEGIPWYSMELVEGETLAQVLSKLKDAEPEAETPFGKKHCAGYFEQLVRAFADVADGLQHAHAKGIIHRDIKPSNLILDSSGKLRILDFGLARLEGQESLTLSGDLMGTVLYMSPEQAMAKRIPLDHRTDVYSLGATMYQVLTDQPPFRGKDQHDTLSQIIVSDPRPPRQLSPRIPVDLETIVLKCLRKPAGERYGTAEALGQDLRRFVRGDPIEARPQSALERLATRLVRQRMRFLVAALFLTLLGVVGWLAYRSKQAEFEARRLGYKPAVREVLNRISAAQYSLEVLGDTGISFRSRAGYRSPPDSEVLTALWEARKTHPLEEAADGLAAIVDGVREPDGHYYLAKAYLLLGREDRAESELDKALDCAEGFVPAEVLRSRLAESGDSRSALESLRWKYSAPDDWRHAWVEAHRNVEEQNWSRAATAFRELIRLCEREPEPYIDSDVEAHIGCGMVCLEQREYARAEFHFGAAWSLRREFIQAALLLGYAYYLEGVSLQLERRKELAEETFLDLYGRATPETKDEVAFWIAGVYETLRDRRKGLIWAERLSEQVSDRTAIKELLKSALYYHSGQMHAAIESSRKAIEIRESDVIAHRILASALIDDFYDSSDEDRVRKAPEMLRAARKVAELEETEGSWQNGSLMRMAEALRDRAALRFLQRLVKSRSSTAQGFTRVFWTALLALRPSEAAPARSGFFGEVVEIAPGIGRYNLYPTTAKDELMLLFSHMPFPSGGGADIYYVTRGSRDEAFELPARRLGINTKHRGWNGSGSLAADGSEIYFASKRPGGSGLSDLWVAHFSRPFEPEAGFYGLENLGKQVNTESAEQEPHLSRDGKRLYFRRGSRELWVAARRSRYEPFGNAVRVSSVLDGTWLAGPSISSDELTLFWGDWLPERPGGRGGGDVWMATRERIFDGAGQPVPFGKAVNLGPPVNTGGFDSFPHVTADWPNPGSGLYFSRQGPSGWGIYRATWHPDCNRNRLDDADEIEAGSLEDTDHDGIPDECSRVTRGAEVDAGESSRRTPRLENG